MNDVRKLVDALERASRGETVPGVNKTELCGEAAFMLRALEQDVKRYRELVESLVEASL